MEVKEESACEKMGEDDPPSLEYIEDPYFPRLENGATPSLDEVTEFDHRSLFGEDEGSGGCEWSRETELYLRSLTLDQLLGVPDDELQTVEAEFIPATTSGNSGGGRLSRARRIRLLTKKKLRDVKVTFIDFSKPYLARISSNDNYKKFLHFGDVGTISFWTNFVLDVPFQSVLLFSKSLERV